MCWLNLLLSGTFIFTFDQILFFQRRFIGKRSRRLYAHNRLCRKIFITTVVYLNLYTIVKGNAVDSRRRHQSVTTSQLLILNGTNFYYHTFGRPSQSTQDIVKSKALLYAHQPYTLDRGSKTLKTSFSIRFNFNLDLPLESSCLLLYAQSSGEDASFIQLRYYRGSLWLRYKLTLLMQPKSRLPASLYKKNFYNPFPKSIHLSKLMSLEPNLIIPGHWHKFEMTLFHPIIKTGSQDPNLVLMYIKLDAHDPHYIKFKSASNKIWDYKSPKNIGSTAYLKSLYLGGLPDRVKREPDSLMYPLVLYERNFVGKIENFYAHISPLYEQLNATHSPSLGVLLNLIHGDSKENYLNFTTSPQLSLSGRESISTNDLAPENGEKSLELSRYLSYPSSESANDHEGLGILYTREELSISFKTRTLDGLLFYNGMGSNYLSLRLKNGSLSISTNHDTEAFTFSSIQSFQNLVIADGAWHTLKISRDIQNLLPSMTMLIHINIDGKFKDKFSTTTSSPFFSSKVMFLGGSQYYKGSTPPPERDNFVGCLQKAIWKLDGLRMDILNLVAINHPFFRQRGNIKYNCAQLPIKPVIATQTLYSKAKIGLSSPDSYIDLRQPLVSYIQDLNHTFNGTSLQSISFVIKNTKSDGLIMSMLVPTISNNPDGAIILAIELIGGSLRFLIFVKSHAILSNSSYNRHLHTLDVLIKQRHGPTANKVGPSYGDYSYTHLINVNKVAPLADRILDDLEVVGDECSSTAVRLLFKSGGVLKMEINGINAGQLKVSKSNATSLSAFLTNLLLNRSQIILGKTPLLKSFPHIEHRKEIWSSSVSRGFVGCIENLKINDIAINLGHIVLYRKTSSKHYFLKNLSECSMKKNQSCVQANCMNLKQVCKSSITCECGSEQLVINPLAFRDSKYLEFRGREFVRVTFKEEMSTEVEEIAFWIQTSVGDGLLFATTSYRGQTTYIELSLIESSLKIDLNFGSGPIVFRQGDNLSDGEWHYIMFKRYGQRMEIRLDDKVPEIYTLPSTAPYTKGTANISTTLPLDYSQWDSSLNPVLRYRAIDIAYKPVMSAEPDLRSIPVSRQSGLRHGFVGKMKAFTFNSLALFDILSGGPVTDEDSSERSISIETNVAAIDSNKFESGNISPFGGQSTPAKLGHGPQTSSLGSENAYGLFVAQPITFNTAETFLTLPKPAQDIKMNIYFRFRTTSSVGILFYYEGLDMEFLCIELVKGHINYVFNFGSGPQLLRSSTIHKLDDNKWHEVTVSKTNINDHVLIVDFSVSKTISQDAKFKFFDGQSGTIYVGGVPEQILNFPPGLVQSKIGYQGCLASLNVNGWEPDLLVDSLFKFQPPQLEPGCNGPKEQCLAQTPLTILCENGGKCLQHWDSWSCDCSLTGFSGLRCSEYGAAFRFGAVSAGIPYTNGGIVSYYFPTYDQADSNYETMALGFATAYADADIMSVRSSHSNDYLEIGLKEGHLVVVTDLGAGEKTLMLHKRENQNEKELKSKRINTNKNPGLADGAYHVVNYLRRGPNMTIQVDGYSLTRAFPEMGIKDSAVFNSVAEIYVGGSSIYKKRRKRDISIIFESTFNSRKKRAPKPHFIGLLSAVSFNGLMVLEEALRGNSNIFVEGDVEKVTSVVDELKRLAALTAITGNIQQSSQKIITITTTAFSSLIRGSLNCVDNIKDRIECSSTAISSDNRLVTGIITKSPTLSKKVKLKGLEKTIGVIIDDDDSIIEDEDGSGSGYLGKNIYLNDKHSENDKHIANPNNANQNIPINSKKMEILRTNATTATITITTFPDIRSIISSTSAIKTMGLERKTTIAGRGNSKNNKYKVIANGTSLLLYPTKPKNKKSGLTNSTQPPSSKHHQSIPKRKTPSYNFFNPKQSKLFILVCSIVATLLLFICCISVCCCVCTHRRRQRLKLANKATAATTAASESLLPDYGKEKSGLLAEPGFGKKPSYLPKPTSTMMEKVSKNTHNRQGNHYTRPIPMASNGKKTNYTPTKGHALKSSTSATTTMMKFSKSEDAVYQNLNATTATEDDASSILFDSYTLPRVDTSENSTIMSRIEGDTFSNKYAPGSTPNAKWSSKKSKDLMGTWPAPKAPDKTSERCVDSESDNSSLPLSTSESVGARYKDANGILTGKRSERKAMLSNASSGKPMKEWYV